MSSPASHSLLSAPDETGNTRQPLLPGEKADDDWTTPSLCCSQRTGGHGTPCGTHKGGRGRGPHRQQGRHDAPRSASCTPPASNRFGHLDNNDSTASALTDVAAETTGESQLTPVTAGGMHGILVAEQQRTGKMLATLKKDLPSKVKSSRDATQTDLATISNGLQNVVTTLNANSNQLTTLLAETLAKIGDSIEESKQARRDYERVNSRITADGTYLQSAMDLLTRKVDSLNANTRESCFTPGTTSTFHPITTPPEWKERSHTTPIDIMEDGRSKPLPHNTPDRRPTTDLERLAAASMPTHRS
jgi:hypothetical protein